jgi:SAM-dependent methyltransferase
MVNFSERSFKLELLDNPDIPAADLYQNLKELEFINTHLGGHKVTLQGIKKLVTDKRKVYHIVDVGCGGGDTLLKMAQWAKKNGFRIRFTGVDMKEDCLNYARKHCQDYPEISFINSDYRDTAFEDADVIVSALFCHHLDSQQFEEFLHWQAKNAQIGFVINDLHRNILAYKSIELLTNLFSKSYLVKNDAKLSVLRGFSRNDLETTFKTSEMKTKIFSYQILWKWAFRWLIIGLTNPPTKFNKE